MRNTINIAFAALLFAVVMPDEDYIGRLAYRAETEVRFTWDDYHREARQFRSLSPDDRRALLYAQQLRVNQRRASGTPMMRIEQTAPKEPLLRVPPGGPWLLPLRTRPHYRRPQSQFYYHIIID